jgi:HlyD family secretion protein
MKTSNLQVLISIFMLLLTSCGNNVNHNVLEGKVKRETISLAPKLAGRILKIYVHESDIVHVGDTLALLDIPEINAKVQQAEGAFFAASSQYEMAKHGATKDQKEQVIAVYNAAKEQFDFAEKSLKRIKNMYEDSLISPQAYDEACSKYNMARSQLEAAKAKKQEVTGGLRDEQVRMAQGQRNQAEGVVNEAHIAFKERYIIAPKEMIIETIALHEGELALPGYNIFVGYDLNATYLRFTISESKVSKFKIDSIYDISLPFKNNEMAKAKLVSIIELAKYAGKTTSYPNYQLGETVYELKFAPVNKEAAKKYFNNFTVMVNY